MERGLLQTVIWTCSMLLCAFQPASSQTAVVETVPLELAVHLLGGGAFETREALEIVVGEIPRDYQTMFPLLPDALVMGSLVRANGVTVIVDVPRTAGAVRQAYSNALEAHGWGLYPIGEHGGFRRATQDYGMYCSAGRSQHLRYAVASVAPDHSRMRVTFDEGSGASPCEMSEGYEPPTDLPMPDLMLPDDVGFRGNSTSMSEDDAKQSALLTTERGPAELVSFFGSELSSQGWSSTTAVVEGLITAQEWERTTEDGRTLHLIVYAYQSPRSPDKKEIAFQITELQGH